jgi:hypothetical protein
MISVNKQSNPEKMKTTMHIRNLKKLAVALCAALVIPAGGFTQATEDDDANDVLVARVNLEHYMYAAAQAVKYVAPDARTVEIENAYANLEMLVVLTEETAKYKAPAAEDEVACELENLDALAELIENSVHYKAPAVADIENATTEKLNLELLTASIEQSLKYNAPDVQEIEGFNGAQKTTAEIMFASEIKVFNPLMHAR